MGNYIYRDIESRRPREEIIRPISAGTVSEVFSPGAICKIVSMNFTFLGTLLSEKVEIKVKSADGIVKKFDSFDPTEKGDLEQTRVYSGWSHNSGDDYTEVTFANSDDVLKNVVFEYQLFE